MSFYIDHSMVYKYNYNYDKFTSFSYVLTNYYNCIIIFYKCIYYIINIYLKLFLELY